MPQLDSCARLHLDARRRIGSYFGLGIVGTLTGAAVASALAIAGGYSVLLAAAATVSTITAFFVGVKTAQVLLGHERIVLYELFLHALASTAVILEILGLPLRAGLDLTVIGIGVMLVFGRVGCLQVGCCHGRPARWGIVYGQDHARSGFASCYVGVRLFAVQLVEAVVTAAIVAICALVYVRYPAGQALCLYASLYGPVRFGLELVRGDDDRPHLAGASEAQWLALVTGWCAAWAGEGWNLPFSTLHNVVAIILTLSMVALVVADRALRYRGWWFRDPGRMRELAEALRRLLSTAGDSIRLIETPSGLRVSCSRERGGLVLGMSCSHQALSMATARALARNVRLLTALEFSGPEAGHAPGFFFLEHYP
jgi:prolipoprotein diacylglyceryltransferase